MSFKDYFHYIGTSPKRPRGDDDASYGQAPSGAGHYDPGGPSRGGGSEDGGRGGGRGRGGGTRGGRGRARQTYEERRRERLEQHDLVISRGVDKYGEKMKKMGGTGRPANLLANYFVLEKRTDWAIYHYRVDFLPEERETRIKKKLLRIHQDTLGAYIFDGSSLYLSHRLNPDVSCVTFITFRVIFAALYINLVKFVGWVHKLRQKYETQIY